MPCPYLDYRRSSDESTFDESRPYCTVAERFVEPMRADICNDCYELDHAEHCEIYLDHQTEDDGVHDGEERVAEGSHQQDEADDRMNGGANDGGTP